MNKIKVLVIDDSAVMRELLKEIISEHPDFEVVATAVNASFALDKIARFKPDVVTLDVEMPGVNGLDFLEKLMRENPLPTLMVSALTPKGSAAALRALELGAVDVISKPNLRDYSDVAHYSKELVNKIRVANAANLSKYQTNKLLANLSPENVKKRSKYKVKLLAIGASTGGTEAAKLILPHLPINCPPIVLVQHMPEGFTKHYAERMDQLCQLTVHEAHHGQQLLPGNIYIAPGGQHLQVIKKNEGYYCALDTNPPVNYIRPSVDVLFNSVAKSVGKEAMGILLTGMGKDGAQGLKAMHDKGCTTLAQNQETCVIYGMPKEAKALGAVTAMVDIHKMTSVICQHLGLD